MIRKTLICRSTSDESTVGSIALGGDWQLTDMNGQPISSDDFKGQWYFLYFGFCHCPDICPDELEKVSAVMTELCEIISKCFNFVNGFSVSLVLLLAAKNNSIPNLKTLDRRRGGCFGVVNRMSRLLAQ